jgi:aconitate hydratase 2/2-methylisocitrate dehydratase
VLEAYRQHVAERAALGISPLPLSAKQTEELIGLLKTPPRRGAIPGRSGDAPRPGGCRRRRQGQGRFLAKIAKGEESCALISKVKATELLGTMLGGFNIKALIELLTSDECGAAAVRV